MNFLAHCALADGHPEYLVGGFLGDFTKGAVPQHLPYGVQAGVRLHRRIDAFSADQIDLRTSAQRLPASARRLAPVFVDLVADHFLARHFASAHGEPLVEFSARAYATLDAHVAHFPAAALRFFRFMQQHDLFALYLDAASVERAFGRICERLRRSDCVEPSMAALRQSYDAFEQDFLRYYPALRQHAQDWLAGEPRLPNSRP